MQLSSNRKTAFAVIAIISMIVIAYQAHVYSRVQVAENWSAVEGQITKSEIMWTTSHHRGRTSRTAYPIVEYSYVVEGVALENDCVSLNGMLSEVSVAGFSLSNKVDKYPAGSAVKVFYNPGNPADSVLETGLPASSLTMLAAAGLALIVSIVALLQSMRTSRQSETETDEPVRSWSAARSTVG